MSRNNGKVHFIIKVHCIITHVTLKRNLIFVSDETKCLISMNRHKESIKKYFNLLIRKVFFIILKSILRRIKVLKFFHIRNETCFLCDIANKLAAAVLPAVRVHVSKNLLFLCVFVHELGSFAFRTPARF